MSDYVKAKIVETLIANTSSCDDVTFLDHNKINETIIRISFNHVTSTNVKSMTTCNMSAIAAAFNATNIG
jgi:endonuclease III